MIHVPEPRLGKAPFGGKVKKKKNMYLNYVSSSEGGKNKKAMPMQSNPPVHAENEQRIKMLRNSEISRSEIIHNG